MSQDTEDAMLLQSSSGRRVPIDIVEQVLLADALRSDALLRPALASAARILLPPAMAADVIERMTARTILSKSALSRSRCLIDCAFMLRQRDVNLACMTSGEGRYRGCVWYLQTDSSPQHHRDYQVNE